MTIAVDVDLLRQHRLGLLAEADEIERGLQPRPARRRAADLGHGRGAGAAVRAGPAAGRRRARARRRARPLAGRRRRDRRRGGDRPRPAHLPGAGAVSLEAVGRSIDVGLAADVASCTRTADQLAALAGSFEQAAMVLGRHASVDEAAFGGLSGIVYRHSSTLLRQGCERTGRRSRRLAEGLTAYAQGMTEVRRQLDEAVTLAAPHLRVAEDRIWSPTRPPGPDDDPAGAGLGRLARRRRPLAGGPRPRGAHVTGVAGGPRPGRDDRRSGPVSRSRSPVVMPPRWVRVRGGYLAPGVHGSGLAPRLEHRAQAFGGSLDDWRLRVAAADAVPARPRRRGRRLLRGGRARHASTGGSATPSPASPP